MGSSDFDPENIRWRIDFSCFWEQNKNYRRKYYEFMMPLHEVFDLGTFKVKASFSFFSCSLNARIGCFS